MSDDTMAPAPRARITVLRVSRVLTVLVYAYVVVCEVVLQPAPFEPVRHGQAAPPP